MTIRHLIPAIKTVQKYKQCIVANHQTVVKSCSVCILYLVDFAAGKIRERLNYDRKLGVEHNTWRNSNLHKHKLQRQERQERQFTEFQKKYRIE